MLALYFNRHSCRLEKPPKRSFWEDFKSGGWRLGDCFTLRNPHFCNFCFGRCFSFRAMLIIKKLKRAIASDNAREKRRGAQASRASHDFSK